MKHITLGIGIMAGMVLMATLIYYGYAAAYIKEESPLTHREPLVKSYTLREQNRDPITSMEQYFSPAELRGILSSNLFLLLHQHKIDLLADKLDAHSLSPEEKSSIKGFYTDLIKYGGRIYPEAGLLLKHYLYGEGRDLELYSNYFFESSAIQEILAAHPQETLIGPVSVETSHDPRIGYALDKFYIKNIPNHREIYQYIDFADRSNTEFEFKSIKVRFPHRLIRVFEEDQEGKGFTVHIKEVSKAR